MDADKDLVSVRVCVCDSVVGSHRSDPEVTNDPSFSIVAHQQPLGNKTHDFI